MGPGSQGWPPCLARLTSDPSTPLAEVLPSAPPVGGRGAAVQPTPGTLCTLSVLFVCVQHACLALPALPTPCQPLRIEAPEAVLFNINMTLLPPRPESVSLGAFG